MLPTDDELIALLYAYALEKMRGMTTAQVCAHFNLRGTITSKVRIQLKRLKTEGKVYNLYPNSSKFCWTVPGKVP